MDQGGIEAVYHRTINTYWPELHGVLVSIENPFLPPVKQLKRFTIKTRDLLEPESLLNGLGAVLTGAGATSFSESEDLHPVLTVQFGHVHIRTTFNDVASIERRRLFEWYFACRPDLKSWIQSVMQLVKPVDKASRSNNGMDVTGWTVCCLAYQQQRGAVKSPFGPHVAPRIIHTRLRKTPNSPRQIVAIDASFDTTIVSVPMAESRGEAPEVPLGEAHEMMQFYSNYHFESSIVSLRNFGHARSLNTKAWNRDACIIVDPLLPFRNHARHIDSTMFHELATRLFPLQSQNNST